MTRRKIDAMHQKYGLSTCGRCGDCCNFLHGRYHDRYLSKCAAYGLTHSEATDWRAKYLACGLFNKPFDQLQPKRRPLIETITRGGAEQDNAPLEGQISL